MTLVCQNVCSQTQQLGFFPKVKVASLLHVSEIYTQLTLECITY